MLKTGLQQLYDRFLRGYLPRKLAAFNGIVVRQPRLFDETDVRPEYEGALVAAIREEVNLSDSVVIVGGGWGVSTVAAARAAGQEGQVLTYEGADEQVERVGETLSLNRVSDQVTLNHATVGTGDNLYGDDNGSKQLGPDELPDCDVLVLDCEGAELDVIPEMTSDPAKIIVETHPMYDSPADEVEEHLSQKGYSVTETRLESTPYGDLPVLTAVRTKDND